MTIVTILTKLVLNEYYKIIQLILPKENLFPLTLYNKKLNKKRSDGLKFNPFSNILLKYMANNLIHLLHER